MDTISIWIFRIILGRRRRWGRRGGRKRWKWIIGLIWFRKKQLGRRLLERRKEIKLRRRVVICLIFRALVKRRKRKMIRKNKY